MLRPGLALLLLLLLAAGPVAAHSGAWIGPNELRHAWTLDPWIVGPLGLAWWLYGRGLFRLWRRAGPGRGIARWRAGCFAAGMVLMVLALVWPLDALGETLFAAHMAQHMLLLLAAPPLLLAGRPLVAWTAGLGGRGKRAVARVQGGLRPLGWLARPWPATLAKGVVLWGWHAPAAFDAALAHEAVHVAEHLCFLATGLVFWWALLHPDRRDPLAPLAGAGAALVTLIHSGVLGALIALAPVPLYDGYIGRGVPWGVDQLTDQQLAGLIMWVPGGLVYLGAGLALLGTMLTRMQGMDAGAGRG